ncbi:MAG: hypothetical protein EZS28_016336 [Streblomastix strix]|uniref:Right handed beta helix domain-containing protein n=1 Tax=Streblomastix strix TaxID=222440 RepID=A0A5J4VZQ1_9EUKA|nr:MAG: hypothetical protein EZS28_016336 [Streblomastix strix]
MKGCYSGQNGGGLFIQIQQSNIETAVFLSNLYIQSCQCKYNGGGIYINARDYSALSLDDQFVVDNCSQIGENHNGGGIYIEMINPFQGIQMEGKYTFRNCYSAQQGGGMYMSTYQQQPILIKCTCFFQNCTSSYGGGMYISHQGSRDLTQLGGNFTFENCSAQSNGGGLFIKTAPNGTLEIDGFTFKECSSGSGGGIFWILINDSKQIINGCQFINCAASQYGGGIAFQFYNNSKLVFNNSCLFYKCFCQECGGAIYASINYSLPFLFNINDTVIQECIAKENTSSSSPTGYGGGIFLTGSGDYNPSKESLDFRGMKINRNYADCGGQSLYIVMPNIIQWCKSGIAGEYIKGNYSDRYSKFEDIEGISADQITFDSLSYETVQQQQSPLQYYWASISVIKKAQATINVSNSNQPLQINLEGYNMIEGQFTVKIVELEEMNDGSTVPINIEGDPQNQQNASFGMKNISWFDFDNKHYGVFISNDGRIFTGVGGRQVEAYPLEDII